jgi:hypothetical protein
MRPHSNSTRAALRRAVWASVVLHALLAGGGVVFLRPTEHAPVAAPGVDTRAEVRMSLAEVTHDAEVTAPAPAPPQVAPDAPPDLPVKPQAAEVTAPQITPPKPLPTTVAPRAEPLHPGPFATSLPRTLPKELGALVRKSGATPPMRDPNVKPAGATGPAASARPMHGALKSGQTVVYVLDCSGSMGAAGKFDAARATLAATLGQQPEAVKFQVIVYDAGARPLLASDGSAMSATSANVRAATEKLGGLEPRGRSNHLVALHAALAFRPDVIVLLTDADDLTAALLKPVFDTGAKVPMCLALVTAAGVQQPRELK